MRNRKSRNGVGVSIALAAMMSLAGPAWAGVVDSPLPVLISGSKTQHVFTVPGVIKNNNLETIFLCTSLQPVGVVFVGVEVFASTGGPPLNDVNFSIDPMTGLVMTGDGVESISPGETATIATGNSVGFHEDDVIDTLGPASVRNGSARIVATSKKIGCSAMVIDELNDPPSSMSALSVLSKKKQKGD